MSCLVGPKPGRSIMLTLILPLTLLVNKAAFTDWSILATISNDLLFFITCSKILCIFRMLGIIEATISTRGSSKTALCLSLSVDKWGDVNPQSICTPSTVSTYVLLSSDSSISTIPFLPTIL